MVHAYPPVTLDDLVNDAALGMTPVLMHPESGRAPVSWLHVTEQVDPRPHLREHELVCTLGSALVRAGNASTFVSALTSSGVSGLVLGLGEVHLEPPRSLISACQEAELPLLSIPHDMPFLAISESLLARRDAIEGESRRREGALLSRLLASVRSGASAEQLESEVASALGGGLGSDGAWVPIVGRGGGAERGAVAPSTEFLVQLAGVFELAGLERARAVVEQQARVGQLVELVSRGLAHPAALGPELEARGLAQGRVQVSLWPAGSEAALAQRWPGALIGVAQQSTAMIDSPRTAEDLREVGLVCGFSSPVEASQIRRGLGEAHAAFRLARRRGANAGPHDLASFESLLEQQSPEMLAPFIERFIAPLIAEDETHRGELLRTLEEFIGQDGRLQATADQLEVHVNTVRHRLLRVREITLRDPLSSEGRADLRVALWAAERRRVLGQRPARPPRF